jgi:hypothetical protein
MEACQALRANSGTSRRELSSSSFSLQGKAPKEIHTILRETLGEHATSYTPVTNCVSQLKHKTVTISEIIVQIHQLILEDRPISAKSIAEQLGISRELFGSIIHEDLDMWEIYAKWDPKCLNTDQKRSDEPLV